MDETTRPSQVGPYRLAEPIGRGGMGTVWRAWDERLKRRVAVKHIRSDVQHAKLRERLWREARAAARLNHPAIVHVYDLVESPDGDWIVMELVEGKTVRALIQETGRLPVAQAVKLALHIAEGLAEAHALGIVHRDLKAANVMVTPTGRAKILDFGLAKQLLREEGGDDQEASISTSGLVVGTSYAMSPEQVLGSSLDSRSDLFSLGSLIYEMLTGEPPFRAATSAASMASVLSVQPPPLVDACPDVPQKLSDLASRLLQKDPRFRPQSAREVIWVLTGLTGVSDLQDDSQPPTVAEPAPLLHSSSDARSTGPGLRRRWRVGLLSIAVALALVLAVWLWQPSSEDRRSPSPPETYVVHIRVLDPQGWPVNGAKVTASAGKKSQQLLEGEWEVVISADKAPVDRWISVSAEHERWDADRKRLQLGENPNPQVEIRLKTPESWLRGDVTSGEYGTPLPGVRVSWLDGTLPVEAITDSKGRYALKLPVRREDKVHVRAELEGWMPDDTYCYTSRNTCALALEKR